MVVCRNECGNQNKIWQNLDGNGAVDGDVDVRGRMTGHEGRMSWGSGSGSVHELEELRVEEANSGQNEILWMEIGEKMGES